MGSRRDERRVMGTEERVERDQEKTAVASDDISKVYVHEADGKIVAEATIIEKTPDGDYLPPRIREAFERSWRRHEASYRYLAGR